MPSEPFLVLFILFSYLLSISQNQQLTSEEAGQQQSSAKQGPGPASPADLPVLGLCSALSISVFKYKEGTDNSSWEEKGHQLFFHKERK